MTTKYYLTAGALLALVAGLIISANAFSIKDLLGLADEEEAAQAAVDGPARPSVDWGKQPGAAAAPLSMDTLRKILANLNREQRAALLGNQARFKQFVQQEARNRSVLAAAIANDLHKDPGAAFLMRRGAETVLRETYLNRLLNSKIAADFPSEEQLREYYENNKAQFVLDERVHVWQLFLATDGKSEADIEAMQKKADELAGQLAAGTVGFTEAVKAHSEHEQSRINAGYVGLVKVAELKPEVRDVIMELQPGQLSQAVRSDTGIHIFRRGETVAAQDVTLGQVDAQIRELLRRQARTQLLNAIFEQAEETYPDDIGDEQIEQWRVQLGSGLLNVNQ